MKPSPCSESCNPNPLPPPASTTNSQYTHRSKPPSPADADGSPLACLVATVGVDHPGRAFIALAVFFRHVGLADDELSPIDLDDTETRDSRLN